MGRELYDAFPVARAVFEEADEALGFSISRLCFDGPDEALRLTENTQPAILTVSVAALRVLAERGVACQFAAGHSLGEYSAHVAAGTLSFADAVRTDYSIRTSKVDAPLCYECGIPMLRTGSCFCCPSCGQSSGCS